MELYKKLAVLRCFTHSDMVRVTGSESAAQWQIKNYLSQHGDGSAGTQSFPNCIPYSRGCLCFTS